MNKKVLFVLADFLIVTIIFFTVSCHKPNKIVLMNKKIASWAMNYAGNGDRYQPIKTELIDTILLVDRITLLIKIEKDREHRKVLETQKRELLRSSNPKKIYGYIFIHECKVRPFNQKLQYKQIRFYTDSNLNIDYASDERF